MRRLRTFFVTGLIVLVPLIATMFFLRLMFIIADGVLQPLITRILGFYLPGSGVISTVILILLTGMLATNYFGKRLINTAELLLTKMPFVRGIYGTTKQIVDAFFHPETTPFKRVCLIEYPRRGIYSIGFVTSEIPRRSDQDTDDMVSIFIAATPNPTFGVYIIVPKRDVVYLDMGVDEGLKMVVSGGIIVPAGGPHIFKMENRRDASE